MRWQRTTRRARRWLIWRALARWATVSRLAAGVTGVVTWGLSDRHSWPEVLEEDYRRFPGAWQNGDGPGLNCGLPCDSSMQRKPMYAAIEAALQAR